MYLLPANISSFISNICRILPNSKTPKTVTTVMRARRQGPAGLDLQSQLVPFIKERSSRTLQLQISLMFSKDGLRSVRSLILAKAG